MSAHDKTEKRQKKLIRRTAKVLARPVTLIVYGWRENAPGTLAWVFPSFGAARAAVGALKNAARWLIVAGSRSDEGVDVESVRRDALVLMECFA
jgi:hypothetical protein